MAQNILNIFILYYILFSLYLIVKESGANVLFAVQRDDADGELWDIDEWHKIFLMFSIYILSYSIDILMLIS